MRVNAGERKSIQLSGQPIGPTLMVGVSDTDPATSWRIDVNVRVEEGEHRLGSVLTTPPIVAPPKARVVLLAFCPGAKGWTLYVDRVAGPPNASADVIMSTSECCAGLPAVGVNPNFPFASAAADPQGEPFAATVSFGAGITGPLSFAPLVPTTRRLIVDTIGVLSTATPITNAVLFSLSTPIGPLIKVGAIGQTIQLGTAAWHVAFGESPDAALFPLAPGVGQQIDVTILGRLLPF